MITCAVKSGPDGFPKRSSFAMHTRPEIVITVIHNMSSLRFIRCFPDNISADYASIPQPVADGPAEERTNIPAFIASIPIIIDETQLACERVQSCNGILWIFH